MKRLFQTLHTVLAIMTAASGAFPAAAFPCSAAETAEYTSAVDDLKLDPSFDAAIYPRDDWDHSLQVIQIAESTDGELFLYVYQPCQNGEYDLTATSVNLSTAINDNLNYENYGLTLLNASGVFGKYVVNDFTVKRDAVRYYDVSAVYRKYYEIDDGLTSMNTVGEAVFPVAKLWTACTVGGEVSYVCTDTEVVTIRPDQKYVGHLTYQNGLDFGIWFYEGYCDSWYLAFDCDYRIEELYEADVIYSERECEYFTMTGMTSYGEWSPKKAELKQDVTVQNDPKGWFGVQHEWKEIQSVEEFIRTENLTEEAKETLSDKQWVLRFAMTEVELHYVLAEIDWTKRYEIADVSVLRLKFETEGKVYNLGVVDVKQSPDPNAPPDNNPDGWSFWNWWNSLEPWQKAVVIGVAVVVFVIACSVIKPLAEIVLFLLKCVWWLLSAPFKGIVYLIKRAGKDKEKRGSKRNDRKK